MARRLSDQLDDIGNNIPEGGVKMNKESLLSLSEAVRNLENLLDISIATFGKMEKKFNSLHEDEHADADTALNTLAEISDTLDEGMEELNEFAVSQSGNSDSTEDGE